MGVMDKFLSYMKLNGDEEYDDYDDDDYYDDDEPVEKISKITPKAKAEPFMEEDKPKKASPQGNSYETAPPDCRQRDGGMCD